MKAISIILLLILSSTLFSQEDSVEVLKFKEVDINAHIIKILYDNSVDFEREEIEALEPIDLGDVLQQIPSVNIKNYGDVGGLKSFSSRGIGAQHNVLTINGFPSTNAQTGMADYSQVPVENINSIGLGIYGSSLDLYTVGAELKGNVVAVNTISSVPMASPSRLIASYKFGSFGQHDVFFLYKKRLKSNRSHFTFDIKQQFYNGDYKYSLNGLDGSSEMVSRQNNAYNTTQLNLNYSNTWNKNGAVNNVSVYTNYTKINNELPGAVILYSNLGSNDEQLTTDKFFISSYFKRFNSFKNWHMQQKFYANVNYEDNRYFDPTNFNSQGEIDNKYYNLTQYYGYIAKATKSFSLNMSFGAELENNLLASNRVDFASPNRIQSKAFYSITKKFSSVELSSKLGLLHVEEQNRESGNWLTPKLGFTPEVKITFFNFYKNMDAMIWFQRSYRLPNFNELYYSQIGNIELESEKVNQLNLGVKLGSNNSVINKLKSRLEFNLFGNIIEDKILAIPTKNLFIWSMQNVGKVMSYGADVSYNFRHDFKNDISLRFNLNYTFQRVLDFTDKESPTYKNQIAYTPEHTANAGFRLKYKKLSFNNDFVFVGDRYALNQNIDKNRVGAFGVYNINFAFQIRETAGSKLRAVLGIKNVGGKNNQYVKYFVLQGRSYFVKLIYEM